MNEPLKNIEKLLLVMIQGKERMEQKENVKTSDDSLSKEYKQGYADAHHDWLSTLLEIAEGVKHDASIELREKEQR